MCGGGGGGYLGHAGFEMFLPPKVRGPVGHQFCRCGRGVPVLNDIERDWRPGVRGDGVLGLSWCLRVQEPGNHTGPGGWQTRSRGRQEGTEPGPGICSAIGMVGPVQTDGGGGGEALESSKPMRTRPHVCFQSSSSFERCL